MKNVMLSSSGSLKLQPPTYGKLITILSIDGGGIRGIIPAIILEYLESQLQVKLIPLCNTFFVLVCSKIQKQHPYSIFRNNLIFIYFTRNDIFFCNLKYDI